MVRFLLDTSARKLATVKSKLVAGQLLTPRTNYTNHGGVFAMDNGAFSCFDRDAYFRMLDRNRDYMKRCLFVTVPDVVGNARVTRDLYYHFTSRFEQMKPWAEKWAYVLQDGSEDLPLDWPAFRWLFVGGTNEFKDSSACYDIVKAARALDVPVHVGRVNNWKRFKVFADLGATTCDGSGVARFDRQLQDIEQNLMAHPRPREVQANLFGEPQALMQPRRVGEQEVEDETTVEEAADGEYEETQAEA